MSIAIQAHPDRALFVDELVARFPTAVVAWARPPFATRRDASPTWPTKRDALLAHEPEADWHVVLQDDAVPCADFEDHLPRVLEAAGDRLVCLFYRHKPAYPELERQARKVDRRGQGHVVTTGWVLGVGLAFPVARIPDLVAFGDQIPAPYGDDYRVKRWARRRDVESFIPLPSLVDHRPGASLVGHRRERRAWRVA